MADNVTVDNGGLTDYTVSADEGSGGQVQRVKLAMSADGSETHVPADSDGLLVNLGTNNDVIANSVGDVAHDVADSGNPVKIGGRAHSSAPSAVADGDRVNAYFDTVGRLRVAVDFGAINATLQAGTANVGDVDVLTLPALPAGTNNIGDVDVLSVPAPLSTTGGGTEATAHRVTIANDSTGVLSVDDNGSSLTVDGTVDIGNPGAIGGGTQYTEGDTDASITGTAMLWEDGSDTLRAVSASKPLPIGDAGGSLTVDGTVTINAIPAGTNNIGDVDVLTLPADPLGANADAIVAAGATGSISAKLRRATQGLEDLKTGIVLAAGSAAIGKLAANSGVDIGDVDVTSVSGTVTVAGEVDHDAADSGKPQKIGWKAANALPTAVANNDRANGISDLFGRQLTSHIDPAMQVYKSYNDTASRAAGSAQVVWDPTSGKKIAVTNLVISTYGTTAGRIFLFFADDADLTYTAGTDQPLFVGSFAPSATVKPGAVLTFAVPIVCTTADRRLHYQNDAAISVDITIYGYEW